MNENHSTKTSSYERNGNGVSRPVPSQPFSFFEKEANDLDLRQFLGIIQRRSLVIVGVATVVMGIVAYSTLKQKPVYESSFQLLVEPVNDDKTLSRLGVDNNLAKPSLDYPSQIQVLKSPELMGSIVNQLQPAYSGINYDNLLRFLTIRRLGETKIIEVKYQSNDPKKIKVVLDTIANYYLNYSLEKKQTKLRQGVQFVEKQLPSIINRVNKLQNELQLFRQNNNFITPETQIGQITGQINALITQRLTVDQQLIASRATFSNLEGKEGELAALNNAPLYQQLLGQMQQLEAQFAVELARFQGDNPVMQTLQEKRQNLMPLLQQEAQRIMGVKSAEVASQIKILEVQSQELVKVENQLRQQIKQLPVIARKYNELQRDLQFATDSLNRFLTTRENLQIEVAQTELTWQLIQAAVQPQDPISPDIPRGLILGLVASLISGIGAALLMEKADNTYHTVESIKNKIKLPLLGILPFDKKLQNSQSNQYRNLNSRLPSRERVSNRISPGIPGLSNIFRRQSPRNRYYGQGQFWESVQVLYTNIQLLNSDQPIRSLVISSALPGDGKSTVAFQLAQIATAMGKRVLLVDADLRRPQVHHVSNLNNLWGLSNLISTNIPVEQVIQQSPQMDELSVITSGPIPPDPGRLLSSEKMKQLMAHFHQTFDLVIYDVPPLVGLVDVRVLAPHTDGAVLVIRLDKTDKLGLTQAQDSLKISPINVLGIVINGDKTKFSGYDDYYSTANKSLSTTYASRRD
ncbi:MAG: GumC family protein [Gloeotrichia echinulata DVL01]|jgi:succinoglycan biosynthesis transport protein ExoP|nr:polysaccharide biosynthesis tyrosine autokinase [Gloeotrichia echinulata DEX184]